MRRHLACTRVVGPASRVISAVCCCVVLTATLGWLNLPAAAQMPDHFIDLTIEKGLLVRSQGDVHWYNFGVGPNHDVSMARCGCSLAIRATISEFLYGGGTSAPWFSVVLNDDVGIEGQETESFSPVYLDEYLRFGRVNFAPGPNWGYKAVPTKSCNIAVRPHALIASAFPPQLAEGGSIFPTGFWMQPHSYNGTAKDMIAKSLEQGAPVAVRVENQSSPGSFHFQLIVGWDVNFQRTPTETGGFLIADPMWPTASTGHLPGSGTSNDYSGWESTIKEVWFPVATLIEREKDWLVIEDDPGPIEISVLTPAGARNGYDASTGAWLEEDPAVMYQEDGAFADPLGLIPPGLPVKTFFVRDPQPGLYRIQVTGNGNGPFQMSFLSVHQGTPTTLLEVSGTIAVGEQKKYQVLVPAVAGQTPVATEGANFSPVARVGSDRMTVAGTALGFDGGNSIDPDGTIAGYAWDFGDGSTSASAQATHTYTTAGIYQSTLRVTDNLGAIGSATATVRVFPLLPPTATGSTELVSINTDGSEPPFSGFGTIAPAISADGRFVAFQSWRLTGTTEYEIYVRDRQTGTTEKASVANPPVPYALGGREPSISDDGRFVAFHAMGSLPPGTCSLLVRDRQLGTTECVHVSTTGQPLAGGSALHMSADGNLFAFWSDSKNLVANNTNHDLDLYMHDRAKGTTELISTTVANPSTNFSMSSDGRFIAYAGYLDGQTFGPMQLLITDRKTGQIATVSRAKPDWWVDTDPHPSISDDGRFVAFYGGYILGPTEPNPGLPKIFVWDRQTGQSEIVSRSSLGEYANMDSRQPTISADGRYVTFITWSTNLVANDTNNRPDVFVRDRLLGTTDRVNVSTTGDQGNNEDPLMAQPPVISKNGRVVAFVSQSDNMVTGYPPNPSYLYYRVYARDLQASHPVAQPGGTYIGWADAAGSPASIIFDGSASVDPKGLALSAVWDFGDGSPTATAAATQPVSHSYGTAGSYTLTLVVNNGTEEGSATTTVQVLPALQPAVSLSACAAPGTRLPVEIRHYPLVSAAGGWNLGKAPLPAIADSGAGGQRVLNFSGPGLQGSETLPVSTFSSNSTVEYSATVQWTVPAGWGAGVYGVSVEGANGASLTVPCPEPSNHTPDADAGGPYTSTPGQAVSFDGTHSSDADGDPLTYTWLFGDGSTGTGPQPQHSYTRADTYVVRLMVSDGKVTSMPNLGTKSFVQVTVSETSSTDVVAPVTSAVQSPLPNPAGWHRSNMTVALTATDEQGGSGVKQITYSATGASVVASTNVSGSQASVPVTSEGITTISFFATDNAGNIETVKTVTVKLDKTVPTIVGTQSPPANSNGWNNTDVTVHFACVDTLSGLAAGSPPAETLVTQEGAGQSVSGSCTDLAGNSATATMSNINVDKTPPTVVGSRSPQPNQYGWNNTNVTVTFTCADSLSGVDTCGPASQVVTAEGSDQSRTATAVDLAGNVASATIGAINVDRSPPSISCGATPAVLWPPNHQMMNVTTRVDVTDALSGGAEFLLLSATSNEPDNGLGDGDTANDIQGWSFGASTVTGKFRAERSGKGSGRIYSLLYSAQDRAGNRNTCTTTVTVPHNL